MFGLVVCGLWFFGDFGLSLGKLSLVVFVFLFLLVC